MANTQQLEKKRKDLATQRDFDKVGILMRMNKLTYTQLKQIAEIAEDMLKLNMKISK